MKIKNTLKYLAAIPVVILVLVILIPIGALYFLYKILTVPFPSVLLPTSANSTLTV